MNIKKAVFASAAGAVMFGSLIAPAFAAGGPTTGPQAGPGCFGNWRAGSVQAINGTAPGTDNAGALYFSERAGDNSTINADNRAECAAL